MTAPRGIVYLLALIDPATAEHIRANGERIGLADHARHYTGISVNGHFDERMADQLAGNARSAKIVQAALRAGYGWKLVAIWPDQTRSFERYLKSLHGADQYCPECRKRLRRPKTTRAGRRRVPEPQKPPRLLLTPPPYPEGLAAFLALNPSFARPVRATQAAQFAGARTREEWEALGGRVVRAQWEENDQISQKRVTAVVRRARAARAQAGEEFAAHRAEHGRRRRLAAAHVTRAATPRRPRPPAPTRAAPALVGGGAG